MNVQMVKQLDNVLSGKKKPQKLSNPIRFLAQQYIDGIAQHASVSPPKRHLLHMDLSQFTKNIPWYMKDCSTRMSASQQMTTTINEENVCLKQLLSDLNAKSYWRNFCHHKNYTRKRN